MSPLEHPLPTYKVCVRVCVCVCVNRGERLQVTHHPLPQLQACSTPALCQIAPLWDKPKLAWLTTLGRGMEWLPEYAIHVLTVEVCFANKVCIITASSSMEMLHNNQIPAPSNSIINIKVVSIKLCAQSRGGGGILSL